MVSLGWINNCEAPISAEGSWVNNSDCFHCLVLLIAHGLRSIMEGRFMAVYWDLIVVVFTLIC